MASTNSMFTLPSIEDSVPLDTNFPSVSERYFTHYYYIPKKQLIRAKSGIGSPHAPDEETSTNTLEIPCKKLRLDNALTLPRPHSGPPGEEGMPDPRDALPAEVESTDNYTVDGKETLVMVHSNRLCVVSLSPYHPIVRHNLTVEKVEYEVDGVDRLSNKVHGKGKRGAQVMGSKATLCRLFTSDGQSFDVLCGARGKLVQVNERLLSEPNLCRTSQGSDGWLAIVLPNLTVYDGLISALTPSAQYEQLWQQQHSPSRSFSITGTSNVTIECS